MLHFYLLAAFSLTVHITFRLFVNLYIQVSILFQKKAYETNKQIKNPPSPCKTLASNPQAQIGETEKCYFCVQ